MGQPISVKSRDVTTSRVQSNVGHGRVRISWCSCRQCLINKVTEIRTFIRHKDRQYKIETETEMYEYKSVVDAMIHCRALAV